MSQAEREAVKRLVETVAVVQTARKSRVLVLSGAITNITYQRVYNAVQLPVQRLDLLIDSPGGDPDEAYKISRLLQRRSGQFCVLIPRSGKSAATLISLGADEIVMADGAELGPLDTQMSDPRNPELMISALEGFKGLEAVSAFCHQFLDQSVMLIMQQAMRGPKDAIEMATAFAAPVLKPLFEQIDPRELGRLKRALEVAQAYGERLLLVAGYDPQRASDIIQRLVYDYPEHAFAIDCDEAREFGLRAVHCEAVIGDAMREVVSLLPSRDFVGFLTSPPDATTEELNHADQGNSRQAPKIKDSPRQRKDGDSPPDLMG